MLQVVGSYPKFAARFLRQLPPLPPIHNKALAARVRRLKPLSVTTPGIETNETLETLGDSLLSLTVVNFLMHKYPHLKEGDLTHMRSLLTNNIVLTQYARAYNFDKCSEYRAALVIAPHVGDKLLADMFEAYVGGVFTDSGLNGSVKSFQEPPSLLSSVQSWITPLMTPLASFYASLYGYEPARIPFLRRGLRKPIGTNPLGSLAGPVDHCSIGEALDPDVRNRVHTLCEQAKVQYSFKMVPPPPAFKDLTRNGAPLRVALFCFGDVVCGSGEGFSIQNAQLRASMAMAKMLARVRVARTEHGLPLRPASTASQFLADTFA